jgi:hypothetical protein
MKTQSKTPCPQEIADAINKLRGLLAQHYGCDFAIGPIMARGHKIAACNMVDGDLRPLPESPEEYADRRETEIDRANPLD